MRRIPAGTGPVRVNLILADSTEEAVRVVADLIADTVRSSSQNGHGCVLGLPTGGTPVPVYRRLVEDHRAGRLSFAAVTAFNLDEYHPIAADAPLSFRHFMNEQLFKHIDIKPGSARIPRGDLPAAEIPEHATAYESAIAAAGGIDLMFLGIGANGHIGFNEPGSPRSSRTRLVGIADRTRRDAAQAFGGIDLVPRRGVTMGIASILGAKRVVLLATGEAKAAAVARAVEGAAGDDNPASFLQDHADALIVVDPAAAAHLDAIRRPWLVGPVEWTARRIRAAAVDAALRAGKPLLALDESDYRRVGLDELLAGYGSAEELNLTVFRELQATITGWPGGKPSANRRPGDIPREDDDIQPKTVVVFSPHPDDDVIGMGGTVARLVQHGHRVHLAVQTTGHRAVSGGDLDRYLAFMAGFATLAGGEYDALRKALENAGGKNAPDLARASRTLVRHIEAEAAAARCGVKRESVHHLELPLYDHRSTPNEEDIRRVLALLDELQPHQLYAAGDLRDPHGTHLRCLEAVIAALQRAADRPWRKNLRLWLYRGGWDEWTPGDIDRAIPLTEADQLIKRQAIIRHQTQKDQPLFPGDDTREFWQRAEDRCRRAAETFNSLGLPHYPALETFARWDGKTLP